MPEPLLFACSAACRHVHQVAEALELGDFMPAVVMVGGVSVYLVAPKDRMRRHERQHDVQAAAYAPSWARSWWCPLAVAAWLGRPQWSVEYVRLYSTHGFANHPFEKDARDAEEPTTPGVRPPRGRGDLL